MSVFSLILIGRNQTNIHNNHSFHSFSEMNSENIVIVGATGATGSQLVQQALEQGYKVTAPVRNPQKLAHINHKNLEVRIFFFE